MSNISDPLGPLLQRYPISAAVFHAGALCGLTSYERDEHNGHFHLVRRGRVKVLGLPGGSVTMDGPSLLCLPRPAHHKIYVHAAEEAQVVCAEVRLGSGGGNSLRDSLPDKLLLDLRHPVRRPHVWRHFTTKGLLNIPVASSRWIDCVNS